VGHRAALLVRPAVQSKRPVKALKRKQNSGLLTRIKELPEVSQ
jgi:hypothetical protein